MKFSKEVIIGIIAGLVMGIPQGMRDLPVLSGKLGSPDQRGGIAAFGFIAGLIIGMQLLSRANSEPKKHAGFAFFWLVLCLSVFRP